MRTNIPILFLLFFTVSSFIKPPKTISETIDYRYAIAINQEKPLEGIYFRTEKGLYKSLEFKGTKTIVIKPFIGWATTATYERDGNTIIVVVGSASLGFEIKNNNTIIGKGIAKGTYLK